MRKLGAPSYLIATKDLVQRSSGRWSLSHTGFAHNNMETLSTCRISTRMISHLVIDPSLPFLDANIKPSRLAKADLDRLLPRKRPISGVVAILWDKLQYGVSALVPLSASSARRFAMCWKTRKTIGLS
ncbi:uncharacterized protein PV07_05300 [Cladophialophora immunda]|uniref:Uncharacterized protein n=1 Tax=Cladophialophora immunda TaxID=569365 RepID=A0A0D1ZNI1_9EURO|nr:uncharacterized protein PV07_05300 [Cladophialophora immunda]KIW29486.1 hypothetical protein PV07_05300 [Cladophialophora immunda]